jgi:hypothetical protein
MAFTCGVTSMSEKEPMKIENSTLTTMPLSIEPFAIRRAPKTSATQYCQGAKRLWSAARLGQSGTLQRQERTPQ